MIEGPDDFRAIYMRKMEEHREFAERFQRRDGRVVLGLDYGKKHGVVEAMRQSLREVSEEQKLLEELRRSQERPPLPQDLDGVDISDQPPGDDGAPPEPEAGDLPEEAIDVPPPRPAPAEEDAQ